MASYFKIPQLPILFLLGLLIKSSPLAAEITRQQLQQITAPAPAWATPLTADWDKPTQANINITFRIYDVQIHVPASTEFRHYAYKIEDTSALTEYAQISLSYEPELQNIFIHQVRIHRAGTSIDPLDPKDIRIYDNESAANQQVYSGRKNLDINLKDVRVGDTIEYAYSVQQKPGIFYQTLGRNVTAQYFAPIEQYGVRVLVNAGHPIVAKQPGLLRESKQSFGPLDEYRWSADQLPGYSSEDNVPGHNYPNLKLSGFSSWADFVAYILPYYTDVKAPESLNKQIETWKQLPNPREQMKAAATYVQKNIRYLSLSIGSHGWVPHSPDSLVKNGYGDCKDKAYLLHAILNELKIESSVALVDSNGGLQDKEVVPGGHNFDHAIVYAEAEGLPYWIDATMETDEGRFLDYPPNYGEALLLRKDQNQLKSMEVPGNRLPEFDVEEIFDVERDGTAILQRTTIHRGGNARRTRYRLLNEGIQKFERHLNDSLTNEFGSTEAQKPLALEYLPDGSIRISAKYKVTLDKHDAKNFIRLYMIREQFEKPSATAERHFPLNRIHPDSVHQKITINAHFLKVKPDSIVIQNPYYEAQLKWVTNHTGSITGDFNYRSLAHEIPAVALKTYLTDSERLRQAEGMTFDAKGLDGMELSKPEVMGKLIGFLIFVVGLPIFFSIKSLVSSKRGRSFKQKVQGAPGENPHSALSFLNEASFLTWINQKKCEICGQKNFTVSGKQTLILNQVPIQYYDRACLTCNGISTLYGKPATSGTASAKNPQPPSSP